MSIFGKKPENDPQSAPEAPASPPAARPEPTVPSTPTTPSAAPARPTTGGGGSSFLGSGCTLKGELTGAGSLECDGAFDGTIDLSGDVTIGHSGKATAELKARRITIEGRLEGNATGTEKVEVGAAGHVEGDVRAPAVQFAEGAFFEGNVEMRRPKGAAKPADGEADAKDSAGSGPSGSAGGSA